jgi:TFIIF-interacting CTD phosphatase-like protein
MPHNFKLQKENGIFIKNFYGDDKKDQALLDLIPILKSIASNEENDVRQEMKKFEQEIFTKITTDLKDDAV